MGHIELAAPVSTYGILKVFPTEGACFGHLPRSLEKVLILLPICTDPVISPVKAPAFKRQEYREYYEKYGNIQGRHGAS